MPKNSTRKRAPGGGRKPELRDRVQVSTYMEREEAEALGLLGKRSDVVRMALREYLQREDIRASIEEQRELMAMADDAYMQYDGS